MFNAFDCLFTGIESNKKKTFFFVKAPNINTDYIRRYVVAV